MRVEDTRASHRGEDAGGGSDFTVLVNGDTAERLIESLMTPVGPTNAVPKAWHVIARHGSAGKRNKPSPLSHSRHCRGGLSHTVASRLERRFAFDLPSKRPPKDFHRFPQGTYVTSDLVLTRSSLHNCSGKDSKCVNTNKESPGQGSAGNSFVF